MTGEESLSALADAVGISLDTIEKQAVNRRQNGGKTWAEMRAEFADGVSERFRDRTKDTLAKRHERIANEAAGVAEEALKKLKGKLNLMEPRDLIAAAKLATVVKLEIAGDPTRPIGIAQQLDQLSLEELRRLAAET